MEDREWGFPGDEELTDGPDVQAARAALDESSANTDEIDVVLRTSRSLTSDLVEIGRRNHFADKWKLIIAGAAAS
jgi:hypothetical protein